MREITWDEFSAVELRVKNRTGRVSVLAGEDMEAAHNGLQSAAGRIQAAVGAQTRLKRTPRLHFEPDPVVEHATRIEAALREVRIDEDTDDQ